jgi:hypothetical protein
MTSGFAHSRPNPSTRLARVQTNEINVQILFSEPATTSMQNWKAREIGGGNR